MLDHLVYQLVIAETKKPPTFNSAFPIVGKGKMTKKVWRPAIDEYVAQTGRLKQSITVAAEAEINRLQPYHRGATYHEDPLWLLSELDNAYKHRLLILAGFKVSFFSTILNSRGQTITASFEPKVRFEHDAEIARLEISDPTFSVANRDVSVDNELSVAVAFHEIAGRPDVSVLDCLDGLYSHVRGIVEDFSAKFF